MSIIDKIDDLVTEVKMNQDKDKKEISKQVQIVNKAINNYLKAFHKYLATDDVEAGVIIKALHNMQLQIFALEKDSHTIIGWSEKEVSEAKLRGFKNKKALADEIEKMDGRVEAKDTLKFDKILNKYLDKVDPDAKLDMAQAVSKLKDRDAVALYDELLDLHYEDK